jgi:hypothetical protein
VEEKQNFIDLKQNTVHVQCGIRSLLRVLSGGNSEEDFTVSIQNRASSCNLLEAIHLGNNLSEASPQICTENHKFTTVSSTESKSDAPSSQFSMALPIQACLNYKACQIASHSMTHQHRCQHKQPHPQRFNLSQCFDVLAFHADPTHHQKICLSNI